MAGHAGLVILDDKSTIGTPGIAEAVFLVVVGIGVCTVPDIQAEKAHVIVFGRSVIAGGEGDVAYCHAVVDVVLHCERIQACQVALIEKRVLNWAEECLLHPVVGIPHCVLGEGIRRYGQSSCIYN